MKQTKKYYIFCGDKGFKDEYLLNTDLNLDQNHMIEIKWHSEIGKLIRKKWKKLHKSKYETD